jgi:hypothetical protein
MQINAPGAACRSGRHVAGLAVVAGRPAMVDLAASTQPVGDPPGPLTA